MADEEDEERMRRRRRMDLNLYLGLPRSRTFNLGSDLALSSLPLSPTDEMEIPTDYLLHHHLSPTLDSHQENTTTYFPSPMIPVPGFSPVVPIEIDEPESPPRATYYTGPFYAPSSPEPQSPYYFPPRSWSYIPLDLEEPHQSVSVRPFSRTYRPDRSPSYAAPTSLPNTSPTYVPPPYSSPSPSYVRTFPTEEWLGREEESPSRQNMLQSPQFRFRRLIESSHRLRRVRRFRSSIPSPSSSNRLGIGRDSSSGSEELMLDIMSSQRSLGRNGKHKLPTKSVTTESSEDGKEENDKKYAANFECNVCLDMAEDPVVTSCGHLFCWPCLYQWLHVHSDHKECPVCKGEVTEPNIIPIYGRGNSGAGDGKKLLENGEMGPKLPPRPRGNRQESSRQQFRPIPRRFAEGIPLMNRMRASYTMEVLNPESGTETEEIRMPRESTPVPQSSIIPGVLTSGQIGFWRRSGAGLTRESGPETEDVRMSRVPLFRDGISVRRRLSIYDYATADGVAPNMGRADGSDDRYGASSSYLDAWWSERSNSWANVASAASATDQASASSTAAPIRGDAGRLDGSV